MRRASGVLVCGVANCAEVDEGSRAFSWTIYGFWSAGCLRIVHISPVWCWMERFWMGLDGGVFRLMAEFGPFFFRSV